MGLRVRFRLEGLGCRSVQDRLLEFKFRGQGLLCRVLKG